MTQIGVGAHKDAPPGVQGLWIEALEEVRKKYPIGHPQLINEAQRANLSQEQIQELIAHEIFQERKRARIEEYYKEEIKAGGNDPED